MSSYMLFFVPSFFFFFLDINPVDLLPRMCSSWLVLDRDRHIQTDRGTEKGEKLCQDSNVCVFSALSRKDFSFSQKASRTSRSSLFDTRNPRATRQCDFWRFVFRFSFRAYAANNTPLSLYSFCAQTSYC